MAVEAETEGEVVITEGTVARPPVWDSTLCMMHWGKPELQTEVDPNGYVIYVNGRCASFASVNKRPACPGQPLEPSGWSSVDSPLYIHSR